ncbi:tail fiber assembly protein, partial [Escherichia coli]
IKILSVSLWLNRHKEKSVLPEMMGCLRGQIFLHPRMKNLLKLLNQQDSY